MPKRVCSICGKPLADLNKGKECFAHQEGMVITEQAPVTGCTSYDPLSNPAALRPGEDGYNEMAFIESVVGIIDEDGNLNEI